MPTIMPKVMRSRSSWRTSLRATAWMRRRESASMFFPRFAAAGGGHEHILQVRLGLPHRGLHAFMLEQGLHLLRAVAAALVQQGVQVVADLGDSLHVGLPAQELRRLA